MTHPIPSSIITEVHTTGGPGEFFHGHAEELFSDFLSHYEGQIQCIYLDPPFMTGETFHLKAKNSRKSLVIPAYSDKMTDSSYETWMRSMLQGCRSLLTESGSIYLHVDYRLSARMRLLMDEVFGKTNFLNEIIWSYKSGGRSVKHYPHKHDTILLYRKGPKCYFNISAVGVPRGTQRRNHMKRYVDENGKVCFSIKSGGKTYVYYEDTPVYPTDVWTDIEHLQQRDKERTGYDTQKPEALLRRIILASSRPGDLVADFCCGSGTTAAVASKTGRRFLIADASPVSSHVVRRRQLSCGSILSLLEGEHVFKMHYAYHPEKSALDMHLSSDNQEAVISSVTFQDGMHPIYLSSGTLEGSVYHPESVNCDVSLPAKIPVPSASQGMAVIQAVSAAGEIAFFPIG